MKDAEAKAWARMRLKELKTTADDRVLTDIVRLVGTNLQTLSSELEKLAAAAMPTGQITTELVDQLIDRSRELSNFDLGDQLIAGDRRRALETLHRLLEDDVAPVMLLGLIAGNYHRLALAKELLKRGKRDEVYRLIYGPPAKRDAFMNTLPTQRLKQNRSRYSTHRGCRSGDQIFAGRWRPKGRALATGNARVRVSKLEENE